MIEAEFSCCHWVGTRDLGQVCGKRASLYYLNHYTGLPAPCCLQHPRKLAHWTEVTYEEFLGHWYVKEVMDA